MDPTRCIEQLEEHGWCHIPQVYTPSEVAAALEKVRYWYDRMENHLSDRMPYLNRGQPMVYNLQSKERFFLDLLFKVDALETVLKHFLNDQWFKGLPDGDPNYILRSFLARNSVHRMPMHIDSFVPYTGDYCFVMQAAMILEDQDEENGCTVIVPGSHKFGRFTDQGAFETAVPVRATAGDLVMWDSRTWHGALENKSERTRWSIIATLERWWLKQAFDIPRNLPQEIYKGLSNKQKAVLGYCSIPYTDETEGIDMKRTYETLPPSVTRTAVADGV